MREGYYFNYYRGTTLTTTRLQIFVLMTKCKKDQIGDPYEEPCSVKGAF